MKNQENKKPLPYKPKQQRIEKPNSSFNTFVNKYGMFIVFVLSLFFMMNTCSTKNTMRDYTTQHIDSLTIKTNLLVEVNQELTKEIKLLTVQHEISKLELAKRILYDQNAIVRTKIRPDDKIAEYDKELRNLYQKREKLLKE